MISSNRILALLKDPQDLRIEEMEKILHEHGYELSNIKGSHYKFKRENSPFILIPVHHKKVAKIWVKSAIKKLLFYL